MQFRHALVEPMIIRRAEQFTGESAAGDADEGALGWLDLPNPAAAARPEVFIVNKRREAARRVASGTMPRCSGRKSISIPTGSGASAGTAGVRPANECVARSP